MPLAFVEKATVASSRIGVYKKVSAGFMRRAGLGYGDYDTPGFSERRGGGPHKQERLVLS